MEVEVEVQQLAEQLKQAANTIVEGKKGPKYKNTKQIDKEIRRKDNKKLPDGWNSKRTGARTKTKSKGMHALKRWFGDQYSSSDSSESEDKNGEWEGRISREEKNKQRRKKQLEKRELKLKQRKTAEKARHIKRIGPIFPQSLDHHMGNCRGNFERAKMEGREGIFDLLP